jgi:putative transposase
VKGTAKVNPGKGVQIHYLYYWSDLFRNPEIEKRNIPVRYDPFDAGTAYAFVSGQWAECHSEHYMIFHGRSEREIMLASQELRRLRQSHSQYFIVTAAKLAEFLESVEAEEALLEQRLTDTESRYLRAADSTRPVQSPPSRVEQASAPTSRVTWTPRVYGKM